MLTRGKVIVREEGKEEVMSFCTAINCMDGRVQLPIIEFMKKRFMVDHVDVITEPGPNRILAKQTNFNVVESIFERVNISVHHHGSVGIAVVGHHDCAGNPAGPDRQTEHTRAAMECVRRRYSEIPIIGLWVDENWEASEIV